MLAAFEERDVRMGMSDLAKDLSKTNQSSPHHKAAISQMTRVEIDENALLTVPRQLRQSPAEWCRVSDDGFLFGCLIRMIDEN